MNRIDYSEYASHLAEMDSAAFDQYVSRELPQQLSDLWSVEYNRGSANSEIVAVTLETFSYLFDLTSERTVVAFGVMKGKNYQVRDLSRQRGFPMANNRSYDKGHMFPHSGFGGMDINVFFQNRRINRGAFQELEKMAVAAPGSFYFVRLLYGAGLSQRPSNVEQGLFLNGNPPTMEYRFFRN